LNTDFNADCSAPPQRCRSRPCATARGAAGPAAENAGAGAAGRVAQKVLYPSSPLRCFTLPRRDALAVVDPERRGHGSAGRRVAAAALLPTMVAGHTNAATILIGERGADLVREPLRRAA
jgi:choline dehydrogenase-like flavoprotein